MVLDEPTNDLDIDTLELLESLLQDFPGTLFLVSHDRAFLENTVTQVIAFEGNGQLTEFGGGYDDWLRFTEQRASAINVASKTKTQASAIPEPKEKKKTEDKNDKQSQVNETKRSIMIKLINQMAAYKRPEYNMPIIGR